jgi:hypothetical protein
MREFLFFSRKIGNLKIGGHEYAFCHPLDLEIDEFGEFRAVCTLVDEEGYYYDFWWYNWGNPQVKRIGKYKELPEKNIQKIKSYLDRIG